MPIEKDMAVPAKAAQAKRIPVKGEKLTCKVCGLGLIIDDVSSVVAFEEPVCCGTPMKLDPLRPKKPSTAGETRGRQAGSSRYKGSA